MELGRKLVLATTMTIVVLVLYYKITHCSIWHWVSEDCLIVDGVFHEVMNHFVEDLGSDVVQGVTT